MSDSIPLCMRMMRMKMRRILNSWDMVFVVFYNADEDDEDDEDINFLTVVSLLHHCCITVGPLLEYC
eukprot:5310229-Heterocapsa_arctica.AAC.1